MIFTLQLTSTDCVGLVKTDPAVVDMPLRSIRLLWSDVVSEINRARQLMAVVYTPVRVCDLCGAKQVNHALAVVPAQLPSDCVVRVSNCSDCDAWLERQSGAKLRQLIQAAFDRGRGA